MPKKYLVQALALALASLVASTAHAGPYVVMVAKPTLKVSGPTTGTTPPGEATDPLGNSPTPVEATPLLTAEVSSSSLALGNVSYGASATRSVVFTNTGESPLTFSALPYLTADTASDYHSSTTCNATLAPQDSCWANVTFQPKAIGTAYGTLVFPTNALNGPHNIALSGTGVSAHYETFVSGVASKTLPAFTGVQIGSTSAAASFTVKNTGNIVGTPAPSSGAAQFAVSGCTGPLAPGESCTVNVTFTPSSATEVNSAVTLAATADSLVTNVDVSGTGSAVSASNWRITPSLGRDNWYGMAFGAGRFIAVGYAGKVQTSTDGVQWSSPGTIPGWNGGGMRWTSYQNGLFLTVGQTQIGYSGDGLNWGTTPIAYGSWNGFAYGNGIYVAVDASPNGLTAYSSSGTSGWTTKANGGRYTQVAFGAGKFIANSFVASTKLGVTTDGVNWSTINNPLPGANNGGINYVNGRFILVQGAQFATSTDGVTWSTGSLPVDFNNGYPYIAYGGGSYVILGEGTRLVTSTDGVNWSAATPPNQNWSGIAYGNGRFAASTYNGYYMGYTQ